MQTSLEMLCGTSYIFQVSDAEVVVLLPRGGRLCWLWTLLYLQSGVTQACCLKHVCAVGCRMLLKADAFPFLTKCETINLKLGSLVVSFVLEFFLKQYLRLHKVGFNRSIHKCIWQDLSCHTHSYLFNQQIFCSSIDLSEDFGFQTSLFPTMHRNFGFFYRKTHWISIMFCLVIEVYKMFLILRISKHLLLLLQKH